MLHLENISVSFNQQMTLKKKVIDGLNLTLDSGDFMHVLGHNGAGKSTLLNLIAGLIIPDEGEVILDGKKMTSLSVEARAEWIGQVFQNPQDGTCAALTVEENMALGWMRGQPKNLKKALGRKARQLFQELLSDLGMGLENVLYQPMGLLSGGQRQAIQLLIATLKPPKILLLDEHTAALDPIATEMILALTDKLVKKYQLTVVMITHRLVDALNYGNKIILMQQGRIKALFNQQEKEALTPEMLLYQFNT